MVFFLIISSVVVFLSLVFLLMVLLTRFSCFALMILQRMNKFPLVRTYRRLKTKQETICPMRTFQEVWSIKRKRQKTCVTALKLPARNLRLINFSVDSINLSHRFFLFCEKITKYFGKPQS